MTLTTITYLIYLLGSITLALYVGQVLFKNGQAFLDEIFAYSPKLAASVNQLLLVGFYLVNIGYIGLSMKMGIQVSSFDGMLVTLGTKVGTIMLILALMHFANIMILFRLRKGHIQSLPHSS